MNVAELNTRLEAFKALQMGRSVQAKFASTDPITGVRFTEGTTIRMLMGAPLTVDGVEVLSLAARVDGQFVNGIEGDGRYFTVNRRAAAVEFEVKGENVYAKANYGRLTSVAAYTSQKLRHQIALIKSR